MCRNIKPLFNYDPPVTDDEVYASALQYVRKVSGFRTPSNINKNAFDHAVHNITKITKELIGTLETSATPHNREEEMKKAQARAQRRFRTEF